MDKSVLIIGAEKNPYILDVEKKIFSMGFQTLLVVNSIEALDRLERELFSIIIYDHKCKSLEGIDFLTQVLRNPFAAVTPLIVLKGPGDPPETVGITSVLDQTFHTGTSTDLIAEYVKETEDLRKKKIKKGNLSNVSVTRLLFDAFNFRFSGAVIFERLAEKKIIYFERGFVVFASSNKPEERFGEFMVAQGLISRDQLSTVLAISQKSTLRFGQILVEMGYIKSDTLMPLLQAQIKQILFSMFDWEIGDYYLLAEESSSISDAPEKFKTPLLISEGIKRKFTTTQILRILNPLSRPIKFNTDKWRSVKGDFPFTKAEIDLTDRIKDGSLLEESLRSSPVSELETLRLLYLLANVNVISLPGEGGVVLNKNIEAKEDTKKTGDVAHVSIETKKDMPKKQVSSKAPVLPHKRAMMEEDVPVVPVTAAERAKIKRPMPLVWKLLIAIGVLSVFFITAVYFYANYSFSVRYVSDGHGTKRSAVNVEIEPAEKEFAPTAAPTVEPKATSTPKPIEEKRVEATSTVTPKVKRPARDTGALFFTYLARARRYYGDGNAEAALLEYEKAYKLNPRNDILLVEMGQILFDEFDRSVEAMEKYKEALKANPNNAKAHLYLGNAYQYHGKNKLASDEYGIFLRLAPNAPEATEIRKLLKTLQGGE